MSSSRPHSYRERRSPLSLGSNPTVRRCQLAAVGAGALFVADWAATIANLGTVALNLIFTLLVMAIFPAGALARSKLPAHLRGWGALTLGALFLQIIANAIWYVDYLHDAPRLPGVGLWTITLYVALAVAAAAAWTDVREILRPRDAFLDYSIVVAAAASIGAAIVGHHLTGPWTASIVSNVISASLSLLIVVIIGSAALGRWQALPIPVGLMGASLLFDAAGFLWSSYSFTQGALYTNNRWPTALWLTAAVLALLIALAVIAGQNQPMHLTRKPVPGISPIALLVPAGLALAIAAGVAVLGAANANPIALYTGLGAVTWIAAASLVRASTGLAETRAAYNELDAAHLQLEHAHERSAGLVAQLEHRNSELAAAQAMLPKGM